ncbi:MAG: hypothetical protein QOG99_721 [Frankiales bacterium]|nr:hypothetical protein [Frankiales bacterium]
MTSPEREIASVDVEHLRLLRANVRRFIADCGTRFDAEGLRLLDVAPQDHEGAGPSFPLASVETLDIDPAAGATYTADLCADNSATISSASFDIVVCTEVLEHTRQPFDAVTEILRLLSPGGQLLLTVPFNFRIHGPLPDCWRFTEHGLRELLKEMDVEELVALEDPERFLMPIHYTVVARKR